jgi:hypothetical protein
MVTFPSEFIEHIAFKTLIWVVIFLLVLWGMNFNYNEYLRVHFVIFSFPSYLFLVLTRLMYNKNYSIFLVWFIISLPFFAASYLFSLTEVLKSEFNYVGFFINVFIFYAYNVLVFVSIELVVFFIAIYFRCLLLLSVLSIIFRLPTRTMSRWR